METAPWSTDDEAIPWFPRGMVNLSPGHLSCSITTILHQPRMASLRPSDHGAVSWDCWVVLLNERYVESGVLNGESCNVARSCATVACRFCRLVHGWTMGLGGQQFVVAFAHLPCGCQECRISRAFQQPASLSHASFLRGRA